LMLGGSGSVTHNCSAVPVVGRRCFTCLSPFSRLVHRSPPYLDVFQVPFPVHCNTFVLKVSSTWFNGDCSESGKTGV